MCMNILEDTSLLCNMIHHPLYAPFAVIGGMDTTFSLHHLTIETIILWLFIGNVFFDASDKMVTQGNIAILFPLALNDVQ